MRHSCRKYLWRLTFTFHKMGIRANFSIDFLKTLPAKHSCFEGIEHQEYVKFSLRFTPGCHINVNVSLQTFVNWPCRQVFFCILVHSLNTKFLTLPHDCVANALPSFICMHLKLVSINYFKFTLWTNERSRQKQQPWNTLSWSLNVFVWLRLLVVTNIKNLWAIFESHLFTKCPDIMFHAFILSSQVSTVAECRGTLFQRLSVPL